MFEVGSPVEQRWLGLRRYWQKRQDGRGLQMMSIETVERPRVGGPGTGGEGAWRVIVLTTTTTPSTTSRTRSPA